MKYTKEEILKAVTTIRDVCEEAEGCYTCPYGNCMGKCQILHGDTPNGWVVKEVEEIWRALE